MTTRAMVILPLLMLALLTPVAAQSPAPESKERSVQFDLRSTRRLVRFRPGSLRNTLWDRPYVASARPDQLA